MYERISLDARQVGQLGGPSRLPDSPPQTSPGSPTLAMLQAVMKQTAVLEETIATLDARLGFVSSPVEQENGGDRTPSVERQRMSPLMESLTDLGLLLRRADARLQFILSRLEI